MYCRFGLAQGVADQLNRVESHPLSPELWPSPLSHVLTAQCCSPAAPSSRGVSFDPESLPSAEVLSSPRAWLLELQSLAAARMNGSLELSTSPLFAGLGVLEEV